MNRRIGIERVYPLGSYSTLRVIDEFVEIPDELATNETVSAKIKSLIIVDAELLYHKYVALRDALDKYDDENATEKLTELRSNLFEELNSILKGE